MNKTNELNPIITRPEDNYPCEALQNAQREPFIHIVVRFYSWRFSQDTFLGFLCNKKATFYAILFCPYQMLES